MWYIVVPHAGQLPLVALVGRLRFWSTTAWGFRMVRLVLHFTQYDIPYLLYIASRSLDCCINLNVPAMNRIAPIPMSGAAILMS